MSKIYLGLFTLSHLSDTGVLAKVRLPENRLEEFKTRLLLGVKEHEFIISHAYFDELNESYPYVFATVIPPTIKMESLIPGFRTVTFTTE